MPGALPWIPLAVDFSLWVAEIEDPKAGFFTKGGDGFSRMLGTLYVLGAYAHAIWPPPLSL